jgi:hypothetical protein
MGMLRLWVLTIAVQVHACFVLLLGVAGGLARHDLRFPPDVPAAQRCLGLQPPHCVGVSAPSIHVGRVQVAL